MNRNRPNYNVIYYDLIQKKHPDKIEACKELLKKENMDATDILELNRRIFPVTRENNGKFKQRHRAYHEADILKILDYQKKNKLNNLQLASHFKMSRNTITKWRRLMKIVK
ncbi:helix-turn-helix domain-containing protein [Chryseobacterium sp. G0186]|uniref:helix-turn-helix domain-containing protein n=1 Tax=Chryseobacterium sp. G0186 TaxID=2487064 RepID=UPI000F4FB6B8|nr:helix-turn-helix domain-containing protein [Chryseobacterium sp. G0186]AZA76238.1 helix-turn-helix domain-containing protein [Chryseobacterium sp. G0186]